MIRLDAISQYQLALKAGNKCLRERLIKGEYPYPQVLDEIFMDSMAVGHVELGIIDIPIDRIVGTKSAGRQAAFAANFMPLLAQNTEFASKWISLCEAHLSDEGIREPIRCYEYLGRFYVQEGNKRVSVLKSFGAPTVSADVVRIIPAWSEEPAVRMYYEFMEFYALSRLYAVSFSKLGSFRKLQAAMGFEPDHVWTEEERRIFRSTYFRFRESIAKYSRRTSETDGDALLVFLQVFSFEELREMDRQKLESAVKRIWDDLQLQNKKDPIDVSMSTPDASKGIINKFIDSFIIPEHLDIAFVHECPPERSEWVQAHELGRKYLEQVLDDKVTTRTYITEDISQADELMEQAVNEGAELIFVTSTRLISACRKTAVKYPAVKVLNCSVSMPFPGVRTYYCRIYEGKFISGALAGAMTRTGRIGYVASDPIFGVPAGINAFALGARLTNPDVKIILRWSSVMVDTFSDLRANGVDIISNRDIPTPEQSQDVWGLFRIEDDGSYTPIGSPFWNWGDVYVHIVNNILCGGWDELDYKKSGKATNYWWGMSSGAVDITLNKSLPDGMTELVGILKNGIISGSIVPFHRRITAQGGRLINDGSRWLSPEEILYMDWLCDNVEGSIPQFDELLPIAKNLVRLQGIYRDGIEPERGGILL